MERKDDNDWVKRCITWEVEGTRQSGRPKKTWWDCVKNNMEGLGLYQKDDWIYGDGSPGKMAVKMEQPRLRGDGTHLGISIFQI